MNAAPLSVVRPLAVGLVALAALLGGLGAWSAMTVIAGAVLAPGTVTVEGSRRPVQHLEGGVVEAVFVAEGDRVAAGELLVRFDGRLLRTERTVIAGQLAELAARRARLVAERDGTAGLVLPRGLPEGARAAFEDERRLFEARLDARAGRISQLTEQVEQAEAEIGGIAARAAALAAERALVAEQVAAQQALLDRGLARRAEVIPLRRDMARIDGDLGELAARIARLRAEIAETRLAIIAQDDEGREEALAELREIAPREAELRERLHSLDGTLDRLDLRAPLAGVVMGLTVTAGGAVVRPAEVMLTLVPEGERRLIEVRIRATDIDRVRPGQPARLRFSAFDREVAPEVPAQVLRVSADALVDDVTGVSYYTAEIHPAAGALDGLSLLPGMPVEAYVLTGERTALAYLLAPLSDYFVRAFRES